MTVQDRAIRRGRKLYVLEAALEYLISILVAGSFLATLTRELGMSDGLTGILSSVISLGCLFQLLSVSIRKNRVKPLVVTLSVANQILFLALYLIPLSPFGARVKIVLFAVCVFLAYLIYNLAHPKKINWLMSLVEDKERGIFTANKEILSLVAGMAFSFGMGAMSDHFAARGEIKVAFVISAAVIFAVMLLHTLSMVFAAEPEQKCPPKRSLRQGFADMLRDKTLRKITLVFVLYQVAHSVSTPFYGTYQINELGFGLKFVSLLAIVSSAARILVSKAWGRYADRRSFAVMIEKCFVLFALANLCAAAATPKTGAVMFTLYYIFHGISMGGINSALINLIFDYVPHATRADSLAVCQAASGAVGFATTLCVSPLITHIQTNGNTLFGIPLYAQQVTAAIGVLVTVLAIFYVRTNLIGQKEREG